MSGRRRYSRRSGRSARSGKTYYTYSLNLQGGKKYVGMTSNPHNRINQHFSGNGAKYTQKNKPVSVNHVQKCKSYTSAKNAERIVYYNMKNYHGGDNVRGAGHTNSN
jgi:predicted GIY-YIG superfamily endonuclease